MNGVIKRDMAYDYTVKSLSTFVCDTCSCGGVKLTTENNCVIAECDHLKQWLYGKEIVRQESKGNRQ